jgi:hypothetical protein
MNSKKVSLIFFLQIAWSIFGQGPLSASRLDSSFPSERFDIENFTYGIPTTPSLSYSRLSLLIKRSSAWRYSTPRQNKIAEKRHKRTRVSKTFVAQCIKASKRLFFTEKAYWPDCYGYIFLLSISCTLLRGPPIV